MTDKELGLKVFTAFHEWNKTFNPTVYKISLDEFLNSYGKKKDIYLDGVGGGVREAGLSDTKIQSAMRSMAMGSKGKIPENPLDMFKFMSNEALKINWVNAFSYTAKETLKEVGGGFVAVGNSLLTTGKILNFLLPVIALLFVFFWLNKKSGGEFKKMVGMK